MYCPPRADRTIAMKHILPHAISTLAAPLMAAALLTTSPVWAQGGPPPANVRTDAVSNERMAPHMEVPGTIISRHDSRISSEVAGRIEWIAEVGALIEEGEPIARLDQRLLNLRLQENEAEIRSLESSHQYQRAEANRLQELATRNNAAASRVEEAVSAMEVTEQRLIQARVERDRTLYQIERSQMPAPFTGRVVERLVEAGEYAATGTVVARLVDTENIEVTAQAPVSLAQYVGDAATLTVRMGNAVPLEADIRTIIPVGDQLTRTFEIRVALPSGTGIIGTPVRLAVPSNLPRQVLAVPRDAIILRADGTYVFRINEENVAERIAVETGAAQGDRVEVRGALSVDDRVVVRGGERLQPGQTVVVGGDT